MLGLSRPTMCLVFCAALLTALHQWDRAAGEADSDRLAAHLALWSSPQLEQRRQELHARRDTDQAVWRCANEAAKAVAEGRMPLLEGAARLRDAYREKPDFWWDHFRERFTGASDDERLCRALILRVYYLLMPDEARARAAVARLEAELQRQLDRGTLCLP